MTWGRWLLIWWGWRNWRWAQGVWPREPGRAPACAYDWWRRGPLELRRLRQAQWRRCRACGARTPPGYHALGLLCDGCGETAHYFIEEL